VSAMADNKNNADNKTNQDLAPGQSSSAEMSSAQEAEHEARGGVVAGRARQGMFGVRGSGDTSGYGGLTLPAYVPAPAQRPYGGWFDEVTDELLAAVHQRGMPAEAIQQVTVDRGEITYYVSREHLLELCRTLRDDPALRFELCSSVSGVDYGSDVPQRLHSVYHLMSMTYRRRIRLEVAVDFDDAHVPSVVEVYPTADWHERETWDMYGIVYDGHPALTRILMPDDWDGHPQRKDYPLGGIPVEYKGAEIPPPDQRRAYS
jgi:NADH-quinone oxidoreductase subunit C